MKNKIKLLIILTTVVFSSIITSAMQNCEQNNKSQKTDLVNENKLTEEKRLENSYKEFSDEYSKFYVSNNFLKFKNEAEEYEKARDYLIKEHLTTKDIEEYVRNCYIVEPPIEKNPDAKKIYKEFIRKIYFDNATSFLESKVGILNYLKDELVDSYKKIKKIYTEYMSSIENLKNKELLKKFHLTTTEVKDNYKNIEECIKYVQNFEIKS